MAYKTLDEITGIGKIIKIRDKKQKEVIYRLSILDEVSVSDGEQKYFIQFLLLEGDAHCEGDPTRNFVRIGYYTRRNDGRFCLGSQFAPILTLREAYALLKGMIEKGWLDELCGFCKAD